MQLSIRLRKEGKITMPRNLFEISDKKEIDNLIAAGIIEFITELE
jgi:hypothetical protein